MLALGRCPEQTSNHSFSISCTFCQAQSFNDFSLSIEVDFAKYPKMKTSLPARLDFSEIISQQSLPPLMTNL